MPPTFEFLTGQAGTGKTTELKNRIKTLANKWAKQDYAILTATTGIAAINLSGGNGIGETVSTINSRLGYFDTADLQHFLQKGALITKLKHISKLAMNVSIDEVSMMDKIQLDTLHEGILRANEDPAVFNRGGLGLILVGDFLQLPPIKARYAFEANCWKEFKITKLEKIWRQTDREFLDMMNGARRGDGELVSKALYDIEGIMVTSRVDPDFDGTTLVPVNKEVDAINESRLADMIKADSKNRLLEFPTRRWGKQRSEWQIIPETIRVCTNGYVMILANDAPDFTYANGSCGHIADANIDTHTVFVKLKENGREVRVRKVVRKFTQREPPLGYREPEAYMSKEDFIKDWKYGTGTVSTATTVRQGSEQLPIDASIRHSSPSALTKVVTASTTEIGEIGDSVDNIMGNERDITADNLDDSNDSISALYKSYLGKLTRDNRAQSLNGTPIDTPYFDYVDEKWVIGEISYVPIRLAYASSVHKSQGLSLDKVQIDFTHEFFGTPSMAYVALSRCRTPQGLTVVGNRKVFEDRTNISSEVLEWV